ncbi:MULTISPECIES: hypothetical protein [unclassified Roseitalea]|uniref:HdaA/DnaA family protein n=1 Tax=unclassified Roseitalea TaxID=2639107 RepID=UPI00273E440B|nr:MULTISPECIES: hypothetical protein [unclassified Roseitalea]
MSTDRQMLLDLGARPSLARDDLIATASNKAAIGLIDSWPNWPAPVAFVFGPAGSGKSHIAAVWTAMAGAHRLADPCAPSPRDIAIAQTGQPVLCDGLVPADLDETALFHLINAVRGAGGSMLALATAASAPAQWAVRTPDLASRLRAATQVELKLPDDMLLRAVAAKLFADRQIAIDPAVIEYIVARLERSLAAVIEAVDRLDRAALARKSRITRPLAAQVLGAAEPGQGALDS